MPILLTTPKLGFTEVKIAMMRLDLKRKQIFLTFQYGDTVSGAWVPGSLEVEERLVKNQEQVTDGHEEELVAADPVYDVLVGSSIPGATFTDKSADPTWVKLTLTHPTHGALDLWVQLSYVATAANLYQHAIDKGWYAGTIQ